jgi:hypothetical protein
MNSQQQHLADLLDIALGDLHAGRPAERTAYALEQALHVSAYDDLTRGEADDQNWRVVRINSGLAGGPRDP